MSWDAHGQGHGLTWCTGPPGAFHIWSHHCHLQMWVHVNDKWSFSIRGPGTCLSCDYSTLKYTPNHTILHKLAGRSQFHDIKFVWTAQVAWEAVSACSGERNRWLCAAIFWEQTAFSDDLLSQDMTEASALRQSICAKDSLIAVKQKCATERRSWG